MNRERDPVELFRKFASDFGQKYKMPTIRLEDDAVNLLLKYRWPGNIRQLRNIAEQVSVLEENRNISASTLNSYLPNSTGSNLPAVVGQAKKESDFSNEREILYKVLFDMKGDLNDLKKLTLELLKDNDSNKVQRENEGLIRKIYGNQEPEEEAPEENNEVKVSLKEKTPSQIISNFENQQMKTDIPEFRPGDTVVVSVKVREGERTRLQAFEGVVMGVKKAGLNSSFIVRKISSGIGVERTFQTHSPMIDSIKVKRKGDVRQAKLFYLRERSGKSARIKERLE